MTKPKKKKTIKDLIEVHFKYPKDNKKFEEVFNQLPKREQENLIKLANLRLKIPFL